MKSIDGAELEGSMVTDKVLQETVIMAKRKCPHREETTPGSLVEKKMAALVEPSKFCEYWREETKKG